MQNRKSFYSCSPKERMKRKDQEATPKVIPKKVFY